MVAPVFHGAHGTGKDTMGWVVAEILGRQNVASISQDDLDSPFNAHYVRALLVIADEVVNRDNIRDTASWLKKLITDRSIMVNAKNVQQHPIRNRVSGWFTSNEATPVRVEGEGDRRYSVFCQPKIPPPEYKAMLVGLYASEDEFTAEFREEIAAFAHDLLHHKVDKGMAMTVYDNEDRRELAKASMPSGKVFVQEIQERGIDTLMDELSVAFKPAAAAAHSHRPPDVRPGSGVSTGSFVPVDAVYLTYERWGQKHGYQRLLNAAGLGKEFGMANAPWKRHREPDGKRRYVYGPMPTSAELAKKEVA
jgi:phage/plasmid-associated DNA primase